ncbi:calnexin isoform X1 [Patella vulgata]|uniref:calnexin isoform X1 n=1 Tax=Patella vulgata TaxID=6465 RepID=UPI0024A7FC7C|nr:calnexin isoform X1 [Patella vulgata]
MKIRRSLLLLGLLASLLLAVKCEEDDVDDVDVEVEDDGEDDVPPREKPVYKRPTLKENTYFAEPFHTKDDFTKRWVLSEAKKDNTDETIAKYDGKWSVEEPSENPLVGDLGLILKSKAKHHAVSSPLNKPFDFSGKPFIMQYEVRFQNGMECGGAYVKLLSQDSKLPLNKFQDKTPYTIMFGPDKCGNDHKLHFIFRHKNPKTGEIEEKHAKKPAASLDSFFTDKKTHLYTLVIKPDNTFQIKVDGNVVNSGSLLEDFSPPVNPPKEIEDPDDKKPEDWDEREKIADPDATKPVDWDESEPEMIIDEDAVMPDGWLEDEPKLIPDPAATKPDDWDDEMDGEWEAPLIDNEKCADAPGCGPWKKPSIKNPNYKGKWFAPIIDNPNYKGIWQPRMILNPNYFEDLNPYKMTPISALGLELWSMTNDILFDNFLISDDDKVVESWTHSSWVIKNMEEKASSASGLNIWNTLKSSADAKPWLWAVYVVVLLLPIVLLSICFCPKSGPIKSEDIAQRKKTDEATPDDDAVKEGEEAKSDDKKADIGPGGDNTQTTGKSKKSDLEAKDDDEGDDADEEEDEDVEDEQKVKESPRQRKRKPRKE